MEIIEVFKNCGANFSNLPLALYYAASVNNCAIVKYLVESEHADVSAKVKDEDEDDKTALHAAAKGCYPSLVSYLTARKADVNARDSNGMIPLQFTSFLGYFNNNSYELLSS